MDVIHYTQANRSGAALLVFNLVRAMARGEATVSLVCPSDFEYLDHLRADSRNLSISAKIPPMGEVSRARKLWQMLVQTLVGFRTVRALREGRRGSAIVHVNHPGLDFFTLPLFIGFRLSGFRTVLQVHDVLPHRWLLPRSLRFVEWAVLRGMYLAADKLVVHHRGALKLLGEKFGIRSEEVAVIPHGPFRLSDAPVPYKADGAIVALLFGDLRENKGLHLAIRAVQNVRANGHPIELVIAGKASASERSYWRRCKALVESSPAGITVIDRYLEDEEVKEAVAGAHFFLLPYTEYHSQSGVAALALSNGRPVVATRAGGLSDVLIPGRTGILVEQPTVKAVEEALLLTLRLGHNGLRELGRQAFDVYNASHSWDSIAQECFALYQTMKTQP
jgi:glycosyltransferase involved in cell wall biosynthesis